MIFRLDEDNSLRRINPNVAYGYDIRPSIERVITKDLIKEGRLKLNKDLEFISVYLDNTFVNSAYLVSPSHKERLHEILYTLARVILSGERSKPYDKRRWD